MLKWIAAALLLLNIGLYMWIRWYAEEPGTNDVPPLRPELNVNKMRLAREPGVQLVPRVAPPPPVVDVKLACYRLGPFASSDTADAAGTRLTAQSVSFQRQSEDRRSVTGYRLLLPPFASKQAAEAKRKQLTRLGFRDHALLNEEGMQNAISLGLYTVEANAQRMLERLAAKGEQADMQTLYQTRTVYWLDLRIPEPRFAEIRGIDWGSRDIGFVPDTCPALPPTAPVAGEAPAGVPAGDGGI